MVKIEVRTGEARRVQSFLEQRIYEYNAAVTGYHDAESFHALHRNGSGKIIAGVCGYTWGGCCHIAYLWVSDAERGNGLGSAMLDAVEHHALQKNSTFVWLSTHTFQAPGFYSRRGYVRIATIAGYPKAHASMIYVKQLQVRR